uniref:Uncharacterized protein n=1 Tax=Morchella brunnea TaxID=1174671 RepID=A0A8K1MEQ8_9PEZI|nr:hypothetical protein LK370_mgp223 [Morchella brunnea]UBU98359.1 hypothetical protein [Morchella brunnea]
MKRYKKLRASCPISISEGLYARLRQGSLLRREYIFSGRAVFFLDRIFFLWGSAPQEPIFLSCLWPARVASYNYICSCNTTSLAPRSQTRPFFCGSHQQLRPGRSRA